MKIRNAKQVLQAVAQVYTDHPDRFTASALARDTRDERTDWRANDAYKFCTLGLLYRIRDEGAAAYGVVQRAIEATGGHCRIVGVNNDQGREAIIKLARTTAARL